MATPNMMIDYKHAMLLFKNDEERMMKTGWGWTSAKFMAEGVKSFVHKQQQIQNRKEGLKMPE